MVGHLNACVHVSEPGPVDYALYRMGDLVLGLCKRIIGVRRARAIHGGSICLWDPWVQVRQRGPKVETRIRATCVPLATCGGVVLDHVAELVEFFFEEWVLYLCFAPVNRTLLPKTLNKKQLDRTYSAHNPEGLRNGPVVILIHVRVDLLAEVRSATTKEHVHRTDCTLAGSRVDMMEW